MLNVEQANALFAKESVLIGSKDRVPFYRVIELFGKDAAKFVIERERSSGEPDKVFYYNSFWADGHDVDYVTYHGFLQAATYANVLEIKKKQKEKAATDGKTG